MEVDERLAALEAQQYGVTTRADLKRIGLSPKAIRHRVDKCRLVVASRGVFVNPAVPASTAQNILIAVLSGGPTAFASHATAQWLWEGPFADEFAEIEVTTHLPHQPRRDGARFHRSGCLADHDIRVLRGIRVSSPERTILDLSSRFDDAMLGKLVDDALRRRITTLSRLHHVAQLSFAPGRSPSGCKQCWPRGFPAAKATSKISSSLRSDGTTYRCPFGNIASSLQVARVGLTCVT